MAADQDGQNRERELISFPRWAEVLATTQTSTGKREAYRSAIIAFLGFCKRHHAGASVILIQSYLAQLPEQARSGAREALRWWYQAAKGGERAGAGGTEDGQQLGGGAGGALKWRVEVEARRIAGNETLTRSATERTSDDERTEAFPDCERSSIVPKRRQAATPPPKAASDLGATDWERDLIKACRERNFLWRTERTYRDWALRFAAFLRPRSPYAAAKEEVGGFLSHLAVTQRASASTQKQALNALVFLLQEALHRTVGEIDFQRARPGRRVPTVLSGDECRRILGQLDGTHRLMVELAYGSGLRLMELLRLRVHHLDLERLQLHVHTGKGRVKGFAPRGLATM